MQGTFIGAGNTALNKTNACLCGNKSINNINQRVIHALKKNQTWKEGRGIGLVEGVKGTLGDAVIKEGLS